MSGPSLKYPGAKWRIAPWIVAQLPAHKTYVEPFFGSGAVFFCKAPSEAEYVNDIDGDVVNLFRVLREQTQALCDLVELTPYSRDEYELSREPIADPLERARRTLTRYWMSVGGKGGQASGWRHDGVRYHKAQVPSVWAKLPERIAAHAKRLKLAHIENRPALELLGRLNSPSTLAYIDPPYLGDTRSRSLYAVEMMAEAQHLELLDFLVQDWQGTAVVSGYAHPLYEEALADWDRLERRAAAEKGQERTEVLWVKAPRDGLFEARP